MEKYTRIHKILHDLVLSKRLINKSLFELEKIIFLKDKQIKNQSHIFISGLPRSGTTILLNFLFSSNEFASLTYKNMPFILSPHFSKYFSKKNVSKKERLHGDGINFDINSPEAFDEVFFKNKKEFIETELINYIQLILNAVNKNRYLSKNNNNYKRINLISSIFPNSIFLIPIREPLQHSISLLNQHLKFTKFQKKDDFIRRYMNYLGHNEFGLDHKPWHDPINFQDPNNINYWIEQWYLFYKNIHKQYKNYNNCIFVIYEKLINPNYLKTLQNNINLNKIIEINKNYFKNSNIKKIKCDYFEDIYIPAKEIYKNFQNLNYEDII